MPTGVAAAAVSHTTVNLTWSGASATAPAKIKQYRIYRGTNTNTAEIATTKDAQFQDSGLVGGTTYYYQVEAQDTLGQMSGRSAVVSVTPPYVEQWITLTNSDLVVLPAHSGTYACSNQTSGNGNFNKECHLTAGGALVYWQWVEYPGSGNTVGPGYRLTATGEFQVLSEYYGTDTVPPSTPAGLTAHRLSASVVRLTWGASYDLGYMAVGAYRVFRDGVPIEPTTGYTTFDDSVTADHTYTVVAYDATLNHSGHSNGATPVDAAPPTVPTLNPAVEPGPNQVQLTWSGSTDVGTAGLAGYKLYDHGQEIDTTTATSITRTVVAGTAHLYTVRSYDALGNTSADSNAVSFTASSPPEWITLTDSSLNVLPAHTGTYSCSSNVYGNGDFHWECHLIASGASVYSRWVVYPGAQWTETAPGYRFNSSNQFEVQSHLYGVNP